VAYLRYWHEGGRAKTESLCLDATSYDAANVMKWMPSLFVFIARNPDCSETFEIVLSGSRGASSSRTQMH
jgi:hypothetical protein